MSRVDEDREAQRVQERLLLKQRKDAELAKSRTASDSAFARKMTESRLAEDAQVHHAGEEQLHAEQSLADGTPEATHEDGFQRTEAKRKAGEDKGREAGAKRGFGKRLSQEQQRGGASAKARSDAERLSSDRTVRRTAEAQGEQDEARDSHSQEREENASRAHARFGEGEGEERLGKRGAAADADKSRTTGNQGLRQKDGARADVSRQERSATLRKSGTDAAATLRKSGTDAADADGRGGSGQQDSQEKEPGGQQFSGQFRFNPALAPPVPVIKPKDTGASERLRALANEIAQKIVERVRLGRNADGLAEFQIDLKSTVLSGLTIKLSGSHGRVRASFSGRDRDVLKLLRENADGLRAALEGRGLRLEELKIEAVG